MSGTRKMEKFEVDRTTAFKSGTRKMEKLVAPPEQAVISITTPVAEPSPAVLAAARPSVVPDEREEAEVERAPRSARNADREPGIEKLRTRLARKFTTLADQVTDGFVDFRIGAGWWVVELTAPEGMSTGGGKHMLQHLRLRPIRQGHAVLVGGVVNSVAKTAELRDHAHMDMIYRERFGRPLEITSAEWEQFLRKAELVLRQENIATTRAAAPRGAAITARKARTKSAATIALGVTTLAAAVVVWRVLVALWP